MNVDFFSTYKLLIFVAFRKCNKSCNSVNLKQFVWDLKKKKKYKQINFILPMLEVQIRDTQSTGKVNDFNFKPFFF